MKKYWVLLLLSFVFNSCFLGAGTLGSFKTYIFQSTEKRMNDEIELFYKNYPNFEIPKKWAYIDDWDSRGFSSLNGKIFYFKSNPEEMYYVTFFQLDDNHSFKDGLPTTKISLRAVDYGLNRWFKEEHYKKNIKEEQRIEKRFYDEIIVKLEEQMKTKAIEDKSWF